MRLLVKIDLDNIRYLELKIKKKKEIQEDRKKEKYYIDLYGIVIGIHP